MSSKVSFTHISTPTQKIMDNERHEKLSKYLTQTTGTVFDLGFICRSVAFASIPHSKIKGNQYTRTSNNFTITITGNEIGGGIPYGIYPRLILCWLTSEIVKNKSREIILGNSLTHFMRMLGLCATGGRWGTITRFKDQITRLFTSSISFTYCNLKTGKEN